MEPGAAAADSGRRDAWAIDEVVAYVTERGWRRVTLQFPDDMLDQAPAAARSLQEALAAVSDAKVGCVVVCRWRDKVPCSGVGRAVPATAAQRAQPPHRCMPPATARCPLPIAAPPCTPCPHPPQVYVMADTTYNPLSVDEVAAQHVNADCVVRVGGVPCGCVFARSLCTAPSWVLVYENCNQLSIAASAGAHPTTPLLCTHRFTTATPRSRL